MRTYTTDHIVMADDGVTEKIVVKRHSSRKQAMDFARRHSKRIGSFVYVIVHDKGEPVGAMGYYNGFRDHCDDDTAAE